MIKPMNDNKVVTHLRTMFLGLLSIAEGAVRILSLGFLSPNFIMDYLCWEIYQREKVHRERNYN
jgi:hypothetical protein